MNVVFKEIERLERQEQKLRVIQAQIASKKDWKLAEYRRARHALEKGKVYKVFIACPAYRWPLDPHTHNAIQATVAHEGLDCEFQAVVGDAHIERARAMLLMHYLIHPRRPFDYFLNVDWDIEWNAADLYRMCQRAEQHKIGVMGGPYAFKSDSEPGKAGCPVMRAKPNAEVDQTNHTLECSYVGSGFMLIRTGVFDTLMRRYSGLRFNVNPDLHKDMPQTWAGWNSVLIPRPDWGKNHRELLSEDYSFCHRAAMAGERVVMDLTVQLKHWAGEKAYSLPWDRVEG